MKIKVSNYISQFLVDHGITNAFMVVGGGAMHLDDALGHQKGLHVVYNHHEQACAIAAEAYARIHNRIAAVCVTTGPGGTNAITGVVGGWLDSIPMLVISGQVKYETTARGSGLKLRAMGDQEFDITRSVACMTKYCEMVTDKNKIRWCLEKALHLASTGRPGPCWLDVPLNVQGAIVDTDDLYPYDGSEDEALPPKVSDIVANAVIEAIRKSERPVLYAGNGIRLSGGYDVFRRVAEKLNVPVATCWDSIDAIEDENRLYVGRGGIMGDRAGNFAVQNSDLLLAVGNRLSIRQVGYNWGTWARAAQKIVVDIDSEELKKQTVKADFPIWADAKDFFEKLDELLPDSEVLFKGSSWLEQCLTWKKKYPVVLPKHYEDRGAANVYAFIKQLSSVLPEGRITVVGNGSACVVGSHGYEIKKGQRFIINSAIASMGYDLPAAIGACLADDPVNEIVLVTGDGSIQMNIQELQTIVTNKLPVKIFMINNGGYHSIRQTQRNFFEPPLIGIGPESNDLSFPDMSKLAPAYGYPYFCAKKNSELDKAIADTLAVPGYAFCEICVTWDQNFEPKSATKRLPDGTLVSPPLEDLAPFLPEEELRENMYIPTIKKE
ncbi:MAG: thiamine pyrophosphate-binding protein [Clostridia bacterium]|nr:thiamine pyrophosphate-binding protein [Clostridia bacterium]